MIAGTIFGVKRFEIHDGPGTRTTLFLKGCPLRCRWCHNPEGMDARAALGFTGSKCALCGECARVCPEGVHAMDGKTHEIDRAKCAGCGLCEAACPGEALKLYGRKVTPEEILPALIEDRPFFGPAGGVTLSGGEPLLQTEFTLALLTLLKREGIHTAVDTCGYIPREVFDRALPLTDLFLFDIKAFREKTHIAATGVSNRPILDNLLRLCDRGAQIEVRIPLVPGVNTDEIDLIASFLAPLKGIRGVKVLPYHSFAESKYAMLGRTFTAFRQPSAEEVLKAKETLRAAGLNVAE